MVLSFRLQSEVCNIKNFLIIYSKNIQTFPEKLHDLADEGLYGRYILEAYSEEELQMAGDMICPERDRLFTYAGLELLLKRYVIHTRD